MMLTHFHMKISRPFRHRRWATAAAATVLAIVGAVSTAVPANAQSLGFTTIQVANFVPVSFSVDVGGTLNGATERVHVALLDLLSVNLADGGSTAIGTGGTITVSDTLANDNVPLANGQRIMFITRDRENRLSLVTDQGTLTCNLDSSGNGSCT